MYFLYILECDDGSLYTGITTDVKRRFEEHRSGRGGRFTRSHAVVCVAYIEEQPSRSAALKREAEIKRWRKGKKLALIRA